MIICMNNKKPANAEKFLQGTGETEESFRKRYIVGLSHLWAGDVIGFASHQLADILNRPQNKFVSNMDRKEIIIFMRTYLDHLLKSYDQQLKSLTDNM